MSMWGGRPRLQRVSRPAGDTPRQIVFPAKPTTCRNCPPVLSCLRRMLLSEGQNARGADMLPHNATFAREGRCLLFAEYSQSLRDCRGCRTIAWCRYYDRADLREPDRLALARWEDDGAPPT